MVGGKIKPLDYIHDLKKVGAEAGQELKEELKILAEKFRNLRGYL